MLSTVNYTPLSPHSFIQDFVMYSSERSVQFARRFRCEDRTRNLYIFHGFIRQSYISILCHCIVIYVLNVYIDRRRTVIVIYVLQKFIYITECRTICEASCCPQAMKLSYAVILESVMVNVFQLNK